MKQASSRYTGKPVCAVWFIRAAKARGGLVTATKEKPGDRLPLCYQKNILSAADVRRVAEAQPGGAIIHWLDDKCTIAKVYARVAAAQGTFA